MAGTMIYGISELGQRCDQLLYPHHVGILRAHERRQTLPWVLPQYSQRHARPSGVGCPRLIGEHIEHRCWVMSRCHVIAPGFQRRAFA